jgi:AcrR family transcriptional regulator
MGRWEPEARARLERAAMELYGERGYEQTTVAEIANRAGLTERTFFRHFADKREVLFGGAGALKDVLVNGVLGAPASASPIEAIAAGLEGAGAMFQPRHELAMHRQAIIDANTELQERELIKLATLATALSEALQQRGVRDSIANLVAETGMAIFKIAFARWIDPANRSDLSQIIHESLTELKSIF